MILQNQRHGTPHVKVLKFTNLPTFCLQAVSEYEEAAAEEGYWSVCLDNQFSKFSAKMVNLYLTTFRYDEWEKFAEELQVRIKIKPDFF